MLENELGEDWKDEFVVWDNCWGTGNLTRDYRFNELYCSTLFQSELNIGDKYNNEAIKFQFDFQHPNDFNDNFICELIVRLCNVESI